MPNLLFYQSLPELGAFPDFYMQGYTEALKLVTGVRVVPNSSFVEELSKDYRDMFNLVGYPSYYVPIKVGKDHYGFTLKGNKTKKNPHFSLWLNMFNLDALYQDSPYLFVVEGIKDAYLWLYYGLPVVAMLTSTVSEYFFEEVKKLNKIVIFIPDNDATGHLQSVKLVERARSHGIRHFVYQLRMHKDFGDWFDKPALRAIIAEEFKATIKIAKALEAGDASYIHSSRG